MRNSGRWPGYGRVDGGWIRAEFWPTFTFCPATECGAEAGVSATPTMPRALSSAPELKAIQVLLLFFKGKGDGFFYRRFPLIQLARPTMTRNPEGYSVPSKFRNVKLYSAAYASSESDTTKPSSAYPAVVVVAAVVVPDLRADPLSAAALVAPPAFFLPSACMKTEVKVGQHIGITSAQSASDTHGYQVAHITRRARRRSAGEKRVRKRVRNGPT